MQWSQATVFKLPKHISEWGCDAAKKNVSVETNPSQVSYLRHEDKCLFSKENITTEKGLSFMKIYYEEVPLYALIDSGSTISLAGPKHFQQFPSLKQLLKPYDCEALAVCNSTFKFAGQLTFAFSIGQNNFWVCLKYVETMPYSVLLGADFLKPTGINVDFGSGIVTIGNICTTNTNHRAKTKKFTLWHFTTKTLC